MKERVLITVKTYPTLSRKYAELVCTAGVNEQGEWRRIYPVQFRQLNAESAYKKFQWVEAELEKSPTDKRPETFKVRDQQQIRLIGSPLSTAEGWQLRRKHFVDKVNCHHDLDDLIESAHANDISLALFQPTRWLAFVVEDAEREWDSGRLAALEAERSQADLFKDQARVEHDFSVVRKLPYKFSYRIEDERGKISKMMVEDWEIGALYWNCLSRADGDEAVALAKVREKYWNTFVGNSALNTQLILGTTLEHHNKKAPNPFVIVGVLPLPSNYQPHLI